ncbi:MAG: adenosine kinase [Candidatus Heimdallarchaeota archaeon]|nr:adenosine kinase [Candidatus Heimdallarchaeota archaeon]
MKQKILGFGQVLWDLTVNVDFSFLEELTIDVGEHRLVSFQEIKELILKLKKDQHCEIIKNSGGSTANVMSNLAKLGSNSSFCGKCGDDDDGKLYMQILQNEGVTPYSIIDKENATGRLLSFITPDKDRTFIVFWGASEYLPAELVDIKLIQSFDLIHIEGYLITNSYEAIWKILENSKKTTFDLAAYSIINKTRPLLQKMMKRYPPYVLFSNIFEGKAFTQKEEPREIIDSMLEYSENAVLTLGEEGVLVKNSKGEEHFQQAVPTSVLDTTGAGDAFCAGFLYEFLKSGNEIKATELGVRVASETIKKIGARSFHIEQLSKKY